MTMRDMMQACRGPGGKPDFERMKRYMERHDRAGHYDAIGWALFFIWVGIAWLAGVGLGIGLVGVAVITLAMQAVRKMNGLRVEVFWIVVGLGFAMAGLWHLLGIDVPLGPFILIALGLALIFWHVVPSRSHRGR